MFSSGHFEQGVTHLAGLGNTGKGDNHYSSSEWREMRKKKRMETTILFRPIGAERRKMGKRNAWGSSDWIGGEEKGSKKRNEWCSSDWRGKGEGVKKDNEWGSSDWSGVAGNEKKKRRRLAVFGLAR